MEKVVIHPSTVQETEDLKRVLRAEGEVSFEIEGTSQKAWWARTGLDSRIYLHAYFRKRLDEFEKSGLIKKEKKEIISPAVVFLVLQPSSVDEGTLQVKVGNKFLNPIEDYTFNLDLATIYFSEVPKGEITVSYSAFDPSIYHELLRNCNIQV